MKGLNRFSVLRKLFMVPILFTLSGCVYLVVGGIGALGGYVVSPDTVEGITRTESEVVWDTTVEIVSVMGIVTESSPEAGILLADIDKIKVRVTIEPLTENQTMLSVKARKYNFPKIATAQNVFVKIMSQLRE